MFDIEYDRDIDTVNIEVFKRTGFDNDTERRFRCVCCKKPICISESVSSRGHRMICWPCYSIYFNDDILAAHEWMREGDHNVVIGSMSDIAQFEVDFNTYCQHG